MTGEKVTVQNFFDKIFGNIPYEGGFGQEGPPLTMFGNWAHQVPSRPALVPPPYGHIWPGLFPKFFRKYSA